MTWVLPNSARLPIVALALSVAALLLGPASSSAGDEPPSFAAPCPASVSSPCFQATTLASGLDFPTTVTWAPGGRMFIAEKFGYVRLVEPDGTLLPSPVIDIHDHVVNTGDRGLLGIAASAPIDEEGDILLYMLYTHGTPTTTTTQIATSTLTSVLVKANNRVEGGTFNAATGTTVDPTEHTVLGSVTTSPREAGECAPGSPDCACASEGEDCIPAEGYTHTIGTVLVDPKDQSLWVGSGDGYNDGAYTEAASAPFHLRSQDPESLAGKILHIKPDGSGYENSPFCSVPTDTTNNCSKVYAEGFRNPFRFTLREVSGVTRPVVGDVGEGNWEELNDVFRGFNGGWPCYEGNVVAGEPYESSIQCKALATGYDHPFFLFNHYFEEKQRGGAIVAGPVYSGTTYPSSYSGEVFNTDYVHGWINFRSLEDVVDSLETSHSFLTGFAEGHGTPYVSLQQAPDGDLVVVAIYTSPDDPGPASGYVSEIRYAPEDKPPVARATASASCVNTETTAPTVKFTGDGSGDPDGDLDLSYRWDFGDGSPISTEADPSHTYTGAGTYEVHMTVTDSKANSDNAYLTLHIGPGDEPPNAKITSPEPTDQYLAGRPIQLSGETTTPPPVQMSWEPVLDHSDTHVHVLGDIPTETGDAEFTADEFHGADSHYILRFTVSKNGCTTTVSQAMYPQTGRYYLTSLVDGEPLPGLPLTFIHTSEPETVPSGTLSEPAYFQVAKNARATVSAPATWISGGYTYTFASWSDGGAREHEVHPYEYPAHTAEDPQGLTASYSRSNSPPTATIESPPSGQSVPAGTAVTVSGSAHDAEDGAEPGSRLTWTIVRHSNGSETALPSQKGSEAKFTAESAGDPNTTYDVTLVARDSHEAQSAPATITLKTSEASSLGPGAGSGGGPPLGGPLPNPGGSLGKATSPAAPAITLASSKQRRPSVLAGNVTSPLGVRSAQIAIRPARVRGHGCEWWSRGRRGLVRTRKSCRSVSWLNARLKATVGGARWSVALGAALPKGRYLVLARAVDRGGRSVTSFQNDHSGLLVVR